MIWLQALWFGGDAASIVGECACRYRMNWNDYELYCQENFFYDATLIVSTVIVMLILIFCCYGSFFLARKIRRENAFANLYSITTLVGT